MLSESQERMLVVAARGREEEVAKVFRKWGLEVSTIGQVTATGRAEIRFHGETYADMPVTPLTDEAPLYNRPASPPSDLGKRQSAPEVPAPPGGLAPTLRRLPENGGASSKARSRAHCR